MAEKLIGKSFSRKEGPEKVTGQRHYIDDLQLPGMWHGTTVRSKVARGRIKGIVFEPGVAWEEYVIVTAKDIEMSGRGANYVALIMNDQPYLAGEFINHPEEAVVLLAHPDKYKLEAARLKVRIDVEPLPPIFDLEESLAGKSVIWGKDNIFKAIEIVKGDVASVWSKAHTIVEGTYHTGAQEQLYIEPNGMIAQVDDDTGVTVWGSLQCPYYIHKALKVLFDLPDEKVRVIQAETGGGFGGKEEYPSMIAGHAALLSRKAQRPVKLIYDRAEDMVATTKRHPSRTKHRTAVDAQGKLLAMEIDFAIDGGAYATLSAVVLSRGAIHAAGPYECPNVRINAHAVATNSPPHGAFRGFGAPQSVFAIERHFQKVAAAVGLEPEEFRRRNFLRQGAQTATKQEIRDDVNMDALLSQALQATAYEKKRTDFHKGNQEPGQRVRRGIGFATFMHGAGFTGSGERALESVVGVEATKDGKIRVLAASTEIGQGTNTIFAQIAAETLGLSYEDIEVAQPDTRFVPNSGPTVASRTVMVVGKLVESACIGLRQTLVAAGLLKESHDSKAFKMACLTYLRDQPVLKSYSKYKQPSHIQWDDKTYLGDAYATFAWAVYVAEVSVDMTTFVTTVDDFYALQEIGRVVHPIMAAGQIEGGVAQGVGYSLYENIVWREGRMANGSMTNYIMPTAVDVPNIRVEFAEVPTPYGPGGAKGIGELPLDGTAPAIANAIEQAVGVSVDSIPLMPEHLAALCQAKRSSEKVRE